MRYLSKDEVVYLLENGGGEIDGQVWEDMEDIVLFRDIDHEVMTVFSVIGVGLVGLKWLRDGEEFTLRSTWGQVPSRIG